MKKTIGYIFLALLMIPLCASAKDLGVQLKASYFVPSDKDFRTVYGSGVIFGVEGTYPVWKDLHAWLSIAMFGKKGELTYTKEKTEMSLMPIGAGVQYLHRINDRFSIYGGLGFDLNLYREKNQLGKVNDSALGVVLRAGSRVAVTGRWFADVHLGFSSAKVKSADFSFNVGGWQFGLGFGYRFQLK